MAICTHQDLGIRLPSAITEEQCRVIDHFSGHAKDQSLNLLGIDMPGEDVWILQELAASLSHQASTAIVEIGSWTGRTALTMLDACPRAKVYCVDHWQGTIGDDSGDIASRLSGDAVFSAFTNNVRQHLLTGIIPCRGTSEQWAAVWPFQADMIFIDADHSYEACRQDIRQWMPHVRPGGILAGHDYNIFPGVNQAVNELEKFCHAGRSIWFTRAG